MQEYRFLISMYTESTRERSDTFCNLPFDQRLELLSNDLTELGFRLLNMGKIDPRFGLPKNLVIAGNSNPLEHITDYDLPYAFVGELGEQ